MIITIQYVVFDAYVISVLHDILNIVWQQIPRIYDTKQGLQKAKSCLLGLDKISSFTHS